MRKSSAKAMKKAPHKGKVSAAPCIHQKSMLDLSDTVGNFIRYWGFRRVHGQIWVQIYLSSRPLCGVELTNRLGVSKALISPALSELVAYNLIQLVEPDCKIKRYVANPDVFGVIKKVLQTREKVLIEEANAAFQKLKSEQTKKLDLNPEINKENLRMLGDMISCAQAAIEFVSNTASHDEIYQWNGVAL